MLKVCIDAGHGGNDPGAVSRYGVEKDFTLWYAKLLYVTLFDWAPPCSCAMTRYSDITTSLDTRSAIANAEESDVFVSIHMNSCEVDDSAEGFEVFHHPASLRGKSLAKAIELRWPSVTRGVKEANFQVLRETKMPAVLLELGFVNNKEDVEQLSNIFFAEKVIKAICEGITDWHRRDDG